MTSEHRHGPKGNLAAAGDVDARLKALEDRVAVLEQPPAPEPPPPAPVPPATVTVRSIGELYSALVNNEPDIALAPGTYSGGIFFDSRFASRTVPGVVRLDGVTLNGGGLTFRGGVHDLEVTGPSFANWTVNQTGVLMFGGWDEPGAHHITVRKAKVLSSVRRTREDGTVDHGAYFSHARGGCHDILLEDFDVDASNAMGLASGIHMDHGAATGLVNAWNVTVRNLRFRGNGTQGSAVQYPIILWKPPVHDWTFDGARIENANGRPIYFESVGAKAILFRGIVSTGTRLAPPFYSSMGANPPGVTFDGCSLA